MILDGKKWAFVIICKTFIATFRGPCPQIFSSCAALFNKWPTTKEKPYPMISL
jgi:hypothetical protein